ncbi:MAG: TatD family deoxyribonuclease [Planctomycetes bacterium]|nr:TatD family deoxyribonuclease [Planctomycetota bacterium]
MLFDTHAHLDEDAFSQDADEVIVRAVASGVTTMLAVATTVESSRATIALATRFPNVFASVGIHPNYAVQAKPGDWEAIEGLASSPKVIAIGETGLDRYWDHTPFDVQIDYFRRQIELAKRRDLPFIVHCREAEPDVVAVLRQMAGAGQLKGIMHSFCGRQATLDAALELGLHVSFAGMFTFKKNNELRELAKTIPLERLLVETDSPYLAPQPQRGKRNEPAFVRYTAECLAEVFGKTLDEMAAITTANALRLFGLSGEVS